MLSMQNATARVSGQGIMLQNPVWGLTSLLMSYAVGGSPSALQLVLEGHTSGGDIDILDTYSGLTDTTRTVSLSKLYAFFLLIPSWSGGQAVSIAVFMTIEGPGATYQGLNSTSGSFSSISSISVSTSRSIPVGTRLVLATGGSAGITLTLPVPTSRMQPIVFVKVDSGAGAATISGTINGDASGYELVNQWQSVEISTDGTAWYATANN